jgi:hypothetical protein
MEYDNRVGIRTVGLSNGLSFYEVVMTYRTNPSAGEWIDFEVIIDAHWQEVTARGCAKRWAEHYECPLMSHPLSGGSRTVVTE